MISKIKIKDKKLLLIGLTLIVFILVFVAISFYIKIKKGFRLPSDKLSTISGQEDHFSGKQIPSLKPKQIKLPNQLEVEKTAVIYLQPDKESLLTGQEFNVDVLIDGQGKVVDGVEFVLYFNSDLAEVLEITEAKFFSLYPQKNIDKINGEIKVIALQNPEENKNLYKEKIITLKFKAKNNGSLSLEFDHEKTHVAGYGGQELLDKTESWVLTIN